MTLSSKNNLILKKNKAAFCREGHLLCLYFPFRASAKGDLLPSGTQQHEVLLFGSIKEGIFQASHYMVQIEKNTKILV